jgi:butyryl-CoA dehydrogenase
VDFELSPEQMQLREEVRQFAKTEAKSLSPEFEEKSLFPQELHFKIGRKKWLGPIVPSEYSGMGKGAIEYIIIVEEFFRELLFYNHTSVQQEKILLLLGTPEQKAKYLPKLATEYVAATVISEPLAGSSFKKLKTFAERRGDFYVINGHKTHINLAAEADYMGVLVKTHQGLSYLIIEKGTPGIRFEKLDPLSARSSPMYEIYFEDCQIPANQLIGQEGQGLEAFFASFNLSRIGNAAMFNGLARGSLERAIRYAQHREVGDRYVTDFQGIRWMLAELVSELEASALLMYKAAWAADQGKEHALTGSMAKLFAGHTAESIISKTFSLMGANACYRSAPFEHYWREIKGLQIGGGSPEVQKNIVADLFLKNWQL